MLPSTASNSSVESISNRVLPISSMQTNLTRPCERFLSASTANASAE